MARMTNQDHLTPAQQAQEREEALSVHGRCTVCHRTEKQLGLVGAHLHHRGMAPDRDSCDYCDDIWEVLTHRLGYSQQATDLAKRDDVTKMLRRNRDVIAYAQAQGIPPVALGYLFANLRYGEPLPGVSALP